MLKLFFLCLTVGSIAASLEFPSTANDGVCDQSDLYGICFEAALTLTNDGYGLDYDCSLLSVESKCWTKYCSTIPYDAAWKSECGATSSPLKPTPNLPMVPSEASATTTNQASANTRAPSAKGTATAGSETSARVGSQSVVDSGASSSPLRAAKLNMGALALILLLWKF